MSNRGADATVSTKMNGTDQDVSSRSGRSLGFADSRVCPRQRLGLTFCRFYLRQRSDSFGLIDDDLIVS